MGKSSQTIGYRYYLGAEVGLCLGPVDAITQLLIGERIAWAGNVTASALVDIDEPSLFGGDSREGGVSGIMEVRMGEIAQTPDGYMSAVIGARIPANRGICALVFRGRSAVEISGAGLSAFGGSASEFASTPVGLTYAPYIGQSGFMWASGNPYIKAIVPTVTRILQGWTTPVWYSAKAQITQSIDYTAPPNGSCTQQTTLRNACTNSQTTLGMPANGLTTGYTGYAEIDEEWIKITAINDGLEGGNSSYFNTFTCVRGCFGTTPAAHADGAIIYFYQIALAPIQAMNPAHILYQCLTDTMWGMGKPIASVDQTTWTAAADQLYLEGFGLCFIWSSQSSMEDFASEVLKHIDAILDFNLRTGLYELRLVRNDYDPTTLPVFDQTNITKFTAFSRPGWGETTNDLVIKYTDQADGKSASIKVQDLANIFIQGEVVSQTHEYSGIQNPALAYQVGERDLRALSTPLATMEFATNRHAWNVKKGDPIKVTWPALSIESLIVRVIDIDYGALDDGTITLRTIEDVFALPASSYGAPQPSLWANPATPPAPVLNAKVTEVPYYLLQSLIDTQDLAGTESYPLVLAQKPAPQNFQMVVYDDTGSAGLLDTVPVLTTPIEIGTSDYNSTLLLTVAVAWSDTTLTFAAYSGQAPDLYAGGGLALLDDEWIGITSVDLTAMTMVVVRGVLDSVPTAHAVGASVWFVAIGSATHGFFGTSGLAVADKGEQQGYAETGKSVAGESNLSHAKVLLHLHGATWFNPYPPANVKIDGQYFPAQCSGDFTITWNGRNRLQQVVGLVGWTDASLSPETGVSYLLNVYDAATGSLIASFGGLPCLSAGGSFQFSGEAGAATSYRIEFYAVRGGAISNGVICTSTITGYGLGYDEDYGGGEAGSALPRGAVGIVSISGVTPVPLPQWINGAWYSFSRLATLKSTDGLVWTTEGPDSIAAAHPLTADDLAIAGDNVPVNRTSMVCGNGVMAVVSDGVFYYRKLNGAWQVSTEFTSGLLALTFCDSLFVMVENEGVDIYTSPDAQAWTHVGTVGVPNAVSVYGACICVRKVGSTYVTSGSAAGIGTYTYFIATSPDLITWTFTVVPAPLVSACEATYWQGHYYLFSDVLYKSADLQTWTKCATVGVSLPTSGGFFSITQSSLVVYGYVGTTAKMLYARTTDGVTWANFNPPWDFSVEGVGSICGEPTDPSALDSGPPSLFIQVASPVEFGGKLLRILDYSDPDALLMWPPAAPNGHYFGVCAELYLGVVGNSYYADSGLTNRYPQAVMQSHRILRAGKHYLEATIMQFAPGYPQPRQPTFVITVGVITLYGRSDIDWQPRLGDVIGVTLDLIAGTERVYINGVLLRAMPVPLPVNTGYTFYVENDSMEAAFHLNVGQEPFIYPQAGFTAWQD